MNRHRMWVAAGCMTALLGGATPRVAAQAPGTATFLPTSGMNLDYNVGGNWNTGNYPTGAGSAAIFPSPDGTATVRLQIGITLGSLSVTNDDPAAVFTLAPGAAGSLTFDTGAAGPATFTVGGTSVALNNVVTTAAINLTQSTSVSVTNTATAPANVAGALDIRGNVSGGGDFIKTGDGGASFTNASKAYTGATTISGGFLRVNSAGQMTSTSAVTVNSGGQLRLDGAGTFTFGTAVLNLSGTGSTGPLASAGALRLVNATGTNVLTNNVNLNVSATIAVDGSANLQLDGNLVGSGGLTKAGTGTLTLNGTNNLGTGGTTVSAGAVVVNAGSRLNTGNLVFSQSAGQNTAVTLNNATQSVEALSSIFTDTSGTRTQTLTLNGTALTINQTVNGSFGVGAVSTLTSTITGSGSITKQGTGTLTLTGANTYTGGTAVTAGILAVTNTTGSATGTGGVTVGGTGTFAGTGIVSGSVSVQSGGTLNPGVGSTPGVVTLNGGLTMVTNSTYLVDITGANTYDQAVTTVAGQTFDITGATLSFGQKTGNDFTTATRLFILNNPTGTVTGTFNNLGNGAVVTDLFNLGGLGNWFIFYETTNVYLTPAPEPASVLGVTAVGLGLARWVRRRRAATAAVAA